MITDEELGRLLAKWMSAGDADAQGTGGNSRALKEEIRTLEERFRGRAGLKSGESGETRPPEGECGQDRAYLDGNMDFFLDLLTSSDHGSVCPGLIRHINDCYRCFEIYSGVMRGFTLERRKEEPAASKGRR
jgi:hypothetical protein